MTDWDNVEIYIGIQVKMSIGQFYKRDQHLEGWLELKYKFISGTQSFL